MKLISMLYGKIKLNKSLNNIVINTLLFSINYIPLAGRIYDYFYMQIILKKLKSQDFSITIEPYNLCNLRCTMCPYKKMTRPKVQMPLNLFKRIVNEATEMGCHTVMLSQYNEPLMDNLLFERIKFIKDMGLYAQFFSNGTLLTDENIENILNSGVDYINFSFDGATKASYEEIRINANYEKTREGITKLFRRRNERGLKKPFIQVNFIIQKQNKSEVSEFKKIWETNCDSYYPTFADNRDDMTVSIRTLFGLKLKRPYPCFSGKSIIVLSNGKVVPCCIDYDGKEILGDLNTQTLKEVINSEKFKKFYELHINKQGNKIDLCKNCSKLYRESAFFWWFN